MSRANAITHLRIKSPKSVYTYYVPFLLMLFWNIIGASAHPTGNLIKVGDQVLWSYINPVDDPAHLACIMRWDQHTEPEVYYQSRYEASDLMLSYDNGAIYIIERKYEQSSQTFDIRLLKSTLNTAPVVIWDWFKVDQRIGEGGFFMLSDQEMVFGSYPNIYLMRVGGRPSKYFDFEYPIKRIRAVEDSHLLLLADSACYLVQRDGMITRQWQQLIDNQVENAPLNRNQLFDADYGQGQLLLSYWGKRSFELYHAGGERTTLLQLEDPLAPHWVAFLGSGKLLFSSRIIFDGSTPKPYLVHIDHANRQEVIWAVD